MLPDRVRDRLQGMVRNLPGPDGRPPDTDRPQGGYPRGARRFPSRASGVLALSHVRAPGATRPARSRAGPYRTAACGRPRRSAVYPALAVVEQLWHVQSEADLPSLKPFHHWTIETLRVRFRYRQPGLWVLGVRVYRQEQPWLLTPTAEQLGCKSWVLLDSPVSTALLRPVLDDEARSQQIGRLRSARS